MFCQDPPLIVGLFVLAILVMGTIAVCVFSMLLWSVIRGVYSGSLIADIRHIGSPKTWKWRGLGINTAIFLGVAIALYLIGALTKWITCS